MKNRAVVALFVALVLSLPVLAQQQPAASTTDQSQTQSQPASGDTASGKAPLQYETRQGFWGKVNPFARKKYVQRQITPVQNRINELDELTAANSKMIKDVDGAPSRAFSRRPRRPPKPTSKELMPATRPTQRRPPALRP